MDNTAALHDRLLSCLEAILDLEEGFRRLGQEPLLRDELDVVKAFADRAGQLRLEEGEVARLETLTAHILDQCRASGVRPSRRGQVLQ